jgi:hypothetical protein
MANALPEKLVASQDVLVRQIQSETVLLDLKTEHYFGLDDVGSRIWQLINEGRTLREVEVTLKQEYDVADEALCADLERFIRQLTEAGLAAADGAEGPVQGKRDKEQ